MAKSESKKNAVIQSFIRLIGVTNEHINCHLSGAIDLFAVFGTFLTHWMKNAVHLWRAVSSLCDSIRVRCEQ